MEPQRKIILTNNFNVIVKDVQDNTQWLCIFFELLTVDRF